MAPRIVYAANRRIGLECLDLLLESGTRPVYALFPEEPTGTYVEEMESRLDGVPFTVGKPEKSPTLEEELKEANPDLLLSIHYPHVLPPEILEIPKWGALNLHPAYLPYNRGWHTPSWAILDKTPYGATLHWMAEGVDAGPIAFQEPLEVRQNDTADGLYQRALGLEVELFKNNLQAILNGDIPKTDQAGEGTMHKKKDLKEVQTIDLDETATFREFLDRLRALTTNDWNEAARFQSEGEEYAVRVEFKKV